MNEWVFTRAALLGGLVLVGCGPKTSEDDEPTASDLAAIAEGNVERALRGTVKAGGFVADSVTLASSLGTVASSSESCTYPPCTNGVCPPAECVTEPVTVADLRQTRDDMSESIDSLMKTLREKIFTKDNLESESDGSATYLLGPQALCEPDGDSASPGVPTTGSGGSSAGTPAPAARPELEPSCVDRANRLQLRLRLSSPSEGDVDVALLLTSEKRNPATLELYSNHVGVVVNLGELKSTLDALGEDTGSLVSLVGKLDFELRRNAELDYSFLANVLEDVKVGVEATPGETVHYGVGRSVPTFELRLDGNARKVTGTLDVGAVTVDGPLDAFRDTFDPEEYDAIGNPLPRPVYQGALAGLIAGVEGGLTLDGSTDQLTLSHLGLGDQTSTLKLDEATIAALDLNPAAGRHFDLTLEKQESATLMTFDPMLDATLVLKLAPLASQIADISPALLDNVLHLWLEGEKPSLQTRDDELRVVSGTLHYTDAYDPSHDLSAGAGSCLASSGEGGAAETSSGLVVTTCQ
jgi:hypothetical protein